jgi:hypothetical protein
MNHIAELREFLRSCRSRLTPAGAGMPGTFERAQLFDLANRRPVQPRHAESCRTGQSSGPPIAGHLTVTYQALALPGDTGQTLFIHATEPGSTSESALRLLAQLGRGAPGARRMSRPRLSAFSATRLGR